MGRLAFAVAVVLCMALLGGITVRLVSASDLTPSTPLADAIISQTSASDRAVLVAFYNATDGANWYDDTYWLSDVPMGRWHGVSTNSDGRVVGLNITGNRLSGGIPSELGGLTDLRGLHLDGNQLSGGIPPELGGLMDLQALDLSLNQLSGEIPPELGGLTDLVGLNLASNQLSGEIPSELGSLTSLEKLELYSNQLSGEIPSELGSLTNLSQLYMAGNRFTGCIPWELREVAGHDLYELGLPFCDMTGGSPVVVIRFVSAAGAPVRPDSGITLEATFSEPVSGFSLADISVANGMAANLSGNSAVYTFNVTPNAIGEVTVDIAADVAQDADGNGNLAARLPLGIPYDDDGDAEISRDEAITAVIDYFDGRITKEQAIAVIILYFSS